MPCRVSSLGIALHCETDMLSQDGSNRPDEEGTICREAREAKVMERCLVSQMYMNFQICRSRSPKGVQRTIAELGQGVVSNLRGAGVVNEASAGRGPRSAMQVLQLEGLDQAGMTAWMEEARMKAILSNQEQTLKSLRSGLKCYVQFAGTLEQYVPMLHESQLLWQVL